MNLLGDEVIKNPFSSMSNMISLSGMDKFSDDVIAVESLLDDGVGGIGKR